MVFSYVETAKRLRYGGEENLSEKPKLGQDLIRKTACLTPRPTALLEKHILSLVDADDDAWRLINNIIAQNNKKSPIFTEKFLAKVLQLAAKNTNLSTSLPCQITLTSLFSTQHLYQTKHLQSEVTLLQTLFSSLSASPQRIFRLATTLLHIILDNLHRLRDASRAQSFAIQIASILSPHTQFVKRISALQSFIFIPSQLFQISQSHPFFTLLHSPNVHIVFPLIFSNYQQNPDFIAKILNISVQIFQTHFASIISRTDISSEEKEIQIIKTTKSLIAIFAIIASQNVSIQDVSDQVDQLFSSFISFLLLFYDTTSHVHIPIIAKAIVSIISTIHLTKHIFDERISDLLMVCTQIYSPTTISSQIIKRSIETIISSLINFYSSNRLLPSFFKKLSQNLKDRPIFAYLSSIISSSYMLSLLAHSISQLPLSSAMPCVSALVPMTPIRSIDNVAKKSLTLLVSVILESTVEKDLTPLLRCITSDVLPAIKPAKKGRKMPPSCTFLVGSLLLTMIRDKSPCTDEVLELISNAASKNKSNQYKPQSSAALAVSGGNLTSKQFQDKKQLIQLLSNSMGLTTSASCEEALCTLRYVSLAIRLVFHEVDVSDSEVKKTIRRWLDQFVNDTARILKQANVDDSWKIEQNSKLNFFMKNPIEDVLLMFNSLSDVIDVFGNFPTVELVPILQHCIQRWGTTDRMLELLERKFVRKVIGDALCEYLNDLKERLANNENDHSKSGCKDGQGEASQLLHFILMVPRKCLNEEKEHEIARKIAALSKLLCCEKSKKMMVMTLFLFRKGGNGGGLEEWGDGWESLDIIESRFGICCETMDLGERSRQIVQDMVKLILEHINKWHSIMMNIIDEEEDIDHKRKLQVFRVGLNILKIDEMFRLNMCGMMQEWQEKKPQLDEFIIWVEDNIGWYSIVSGKHKNDAWICKMLKEGEDAKQVLKQVENYHPSDNLNYHLQLVALCILTKPLSGMSEQADLIVKLLRCMLKIGVNLTSSPDSNQSERIYNPIALCFQCCEAVLRRTESRSDNQVWPTWEIVSVNALSLVNALARNVDHTGCLDGEKNENEQAIGLLRSLVSCVLYMMKNQRVHGARWSTINLLCASTRLGAKLSRNLDMGQQCGELIAKLISTVDWCHEQGTLTNEAVKTVILTCGQCLCEESAHARFEMIVLDAIACLLQSVPKETMSILTASASSALAIVLNDIVQRSQRIEYDGQ